MRGILATHGIILPPHQCGSRWLDRETEYDRVIVPSLPQYDLRQNRKATSGKLEMPTEEVPGHDED